MAELVAGTAFDFGLNRDGRHCGGRSRQRLFGEREYGGRQRKFVNPAQMSHYNKS